MAKKKYVDDHAEIRAYGDAVLHELSRLGALQREEYGDAWDAIHNGLATLTETFMVVHPLREWLYALTVRQMSLWDDAQETADRSVDYEQIARQHIQEALERMEQGKRTFMQEMEKLYGGVPHD